MATSFRFLPWAQTALGALATDPDATGAASTDHSWRAPGEPRAWGRRRDGRDGWMPMGARIGWLDGEDLLLDPGASYRASQRFAGGERIPLSEQTLRQRLGDCGLLDSVDQKRETLEVRRAIEGSPGQVLHLRANDVMGT